MLCFANIVKINETVIFFKYNFNIYCTHSHDIDSNLNII